MSKRPYFYLARALGSVSFLLALCLSITYVLLWFYYPWRLLAALEIPPWIVQFADKVPSYIAGREEKPIIILGSSLILAPSLILGRPEKPDPYEEQIKQITEHNLSIQNLAIPGAMASDQALITHELIEYEKTPKLIVYTLAPRDFIDNIVGEDTETTPVKMVLSFLTCNKSFLPHNLSLDSFKTCFEEHKNFVERVRKNLGRAIKERACQVSRRPDRRWAAAHGMTGASGEWQLSSVAPSRAQLIEREIAVYKIHYLPPCEKRLNQQLQALDQMLSEAHSANIPVLLVEMPLSKENLSILQDAQQKQFREGVTDISNRHKTEFVSLNEGVLATFKSIEFADSVHLGEDGSRHFVSVLCQVISRSRAFKEAFCK